ncbi:MAG: hypothetical protein HRT90_06810, partial [Candidatus Margulisbacteria bacterium]|nr:hypothetical protein [Candidatus Margulisiibacteriota bacterium]
DIRDTALTGYEDAKLSWRADAQSIWGGRNKYLFRADIIENGQLFDRAGQMVMDQIKAKKLTVNSRHKTLHAKKELSGVFIKRTSSQEDPRSHIYVQSSELKYYSYRKKTILSKEVILKRKGAVIHTEEVEVDNQENIAHIEAPFVFTSASIIAEGTHMKIHIDNDYGEILKDLKVTLKGKGRPSEEGKDREASIRAYDTYLEGGYLRYDFGGKDQVFVKNKVHIYQRDKHIYGKKALYHRLDETFEMEGDVKVEADGLEWLTSRSVSEFKSLDFKEGLMSPFTFYCDKLVFDPGKGVMSATGHVRFEQLGRKVMCDSLVYRDTEGKIILTGRVKITKGGITSLKSEAIEVDIRKETYQSKQGFEVEFELHP